jgi:hypothetical protein
LDSESDEEYPVQFKLQSSIKRKAVPKIWGKWASQDCVVVFMG